MQNEMRDRLIVLLKGSKLCGKRFDDQYSDGTIAIIADHLIENGVIVLPCKIGSTVYTLEKYCNTDPYETTKEIVKPWHCEECCARRDCSFSEFRVEPHIVNSSEAALNIGRYLGTYYFLTHEEAESKMKEMEK